MTLERNAEGLIKPPAGFVQEQQKKSERSSTLDELKRWIAQEHEKALAASPYRSFVMKTPLDTLKNLSPDERDMIDNFEQTTFTRLQRDAKAVDHSRHMWTAGGGSEESFEDHWDLLGEYEHNAARAAEAERRASSPY